MSKIIISLLRCLAWLPLGVLYGLSSMIYLIIYHLLRYRRGVVRKNLSEAFPEKSDKEIRRIEKEYYHYISQVIVETVKLLHISDKEMKRRVEVRNPELVNESVAAEHSVVLMLGHYGNWEWVQEISRYIPDNLYKASIYHPLNNKTWDAVYQKIRSRWQTHIIPQKQAPRKLLDRDNQPWVCGFIADHRPRKNTGDNVVNFLHHHTSVIYGPEELGRKTNADYYFLEMERMKRGHYRITYHKLEPEEEGLPYPYTRAFWKAFESAIRKKPAYWMWSHKRWKNDTLIRE